jgi:hypothetical protein
MQLTIKPTGSTVNMLREGVHVPLSIWEGTTEDGEPVSVAVAYFQVTPFYSNSGKIDLSRFKEKKEKAGLMSNAWRKDKEGK